jgi:hypothetical protein
MLARLCSNAPERKQALLFLKKKKRAAGRQKNFRSWGRVPLRWPTPAVSKSFLLLFFKKEALTCLLSF